MNPASPSVARRGVTAQARTTDGWPVGAAVLTVTDSTGTQVARVTADAEGRLVTEPLPSGTYTAILTANGFGPLARTAVVTQSGSAALGVLPMARSAGGIEMPEPGLWTIDPAHTQISVTARHLGMASVRGKFSEFGGEVQVARPIERSRVHARIQAASIDTGSKMRDDHLRSADFLHVDVHPVIEYQGASVVSAGGDKWRVNGNLTLNGVTQPVPLELEYLGVGPDSWGGTRAAFRAVATLKREDFAITYNQVVKAGIMLIGATLRVELDVEAVRGDVLPGA
ncbi:MAG TPA: YceI family protein [Pseudonocardiaceae bacterium]|jgi:polyisoprenoid-binding protein YceI|nr:YceI family protein [Pseudonocardiaceae bacterium]